MYFRFFALIAGGFLLGSVMFAYLFPLFIRKVNVIELSDDHNPGTANAMKYADVTVGTLGLIGDIGKGALPVLIAIRWADPSSPLFAAVMAAPVLGHAFSPWLHGKGGKAIATTFGVLLGLLPLSYIVFVLAALYIFFSVGLIINPIQSRSILTFTLFAVFSSLLLYQKSIPMLAGCVAISAVVIVRHLKGWKISQSTACFLWNRNMVKPG